MSPRRRTQTDVPETDDPDGSPRDGRPGQTGTENVPQTECQDRWAHYLGFPSEGHACVPSALALRFGDGCHRRMSLRRMTETEGHDGCHTQMSPGAKIKTEVRCVCLCVYVCVCVCVCVCLSVYMLACLPARCLKACLPACLPDGCP